MQTVLLSFNDDKARDHYLQFMKEIADAKATPESSKAIILQALGSVKLNPPIKSDGERMAAVFVSGQKMAEGALTTMMQRFQQEIGSHSATV